MSVKLKKLWEATQDRFWTLNDLSFPVGIEPTKSEPHN